MREALRQLTSTGLVETRPHRGVVVASVTAERLGEMFEVMADLEAACARYAALRMTEQERMALTALHNRARELAWAGDPSDYDRMNHDFHSAIYEGAHNAFLAETAQAMRKRVQPFRQANSGWKAASCIPITNTTRWYGRSCGGTRKAPITPCGAMFRRSAVPRPITSPPSPPSWASPAPDRILYTF